MDLVVEDDSRVGWCFHHVGGQCAQSRWHAMVSFCSDSRHWHRGRFSEEQYPSTLPMAVSPAVGQVRARRASDPTRRGSAAIVGLAGREPRLERRGRLTPGHYADVVVFDHKTIQDHATFDRRTSTLAAYSTSSSMARSTQRWRAHRRQTCRVLRGRLSPDGEASLEKCTSWPWFSRRRGQALVSAHRGPGQAAVPFAAITADRFRPVEPGQRRHLQDRRADPVYKKPQPRPPHRPDVAPQRDAQQLRRLGRPDARGRAGSPGPPTRSFRTLN